MDILTCLALSGLEGTAYATFKFILEQLAAFLLK